jgi:predicted lipoprotein with Yx(FWY)xxD motif
VRRKPLIALAAALLLSGLVFSSTAAGRSAAASGPTVVKVSFNATLKQRILVDGNGRTVYMLVLDTRGKPTCTPEWQQHPLCHRVLPPVTGTPRAGAGVKGSKLGTTRRTDGITQITYNRHPLYYFRGGLGYGVADKSAGDVNGQGFFRMFFVLSPTGRPIIT